jgi:hypothetical protein
MYLFNKMKYNKKTKKKSKKRQFLYNPDDPSKSYDVYIDKNPRDTIPIRFKKISDVKETILKLEKLYNKDKYTHKRITQVAMILYVRLKVYYKNNEKKTHFLLAKRYFIFLKKRTKLKGIMRKKLTFKV